MKNVILSLLVLVGFGWVALATTAPTPAPDAEATQLTLEEPTLETPALLIEPLDDAVQTGGWSCTPSCNSLDGGACTEGTFTRCYHICGEPDICTCPDGTYNCP